MTDEEGTTMPEAGERKAPRWVRSTWRPTPKMSSRFDDARKDENGERGIGLPGLIYGPSWTRSDTAVSAGPIESTSGQLSDAPSGRGYPSPIAGGLLVLGVARIAKLPQLGENRDPNVLRVTPMALAVPCRDNSCVAATASATLGGWPVCLLTRLSKGDHLELAQSVTTARCSPRYTRPGT